MNPSGPPDLPPPAKPTGSSAPAGSPAPPPRAVLADDERLMREQLRARLAEAWPELQIVAEARNGLEAVDLVEAHRPDLVFLDIRMPGLDGIAAARQIAQRSPGPGDVACEIVFITAYDQHAVEAFEQGAVDYVLKPAERARLAVTVDRLRRRLAARRPAAGAPAPGGSGEPASTAAGTPAALQALLERLAERLDAPPAAGGPGTAHLQWIQATVGGLLQMIPVEDVLFFASDEKYTRVQTAQLEALIRKPIKELVDELDPALFWQIHRSTLVNARAIAGVARDFRGRQLVSIRGRPEKLEVSRSFSHRFRGM